MLSCQSNCNGVSRLGFNTRTGKFEVSIDLTEGKHIRKSFYFYRNAVRRLKHYRKKYDLNK